ncbi:MAG TPA: hypothetical protein VFK41_01585 [Nocardioidaceae bacterium]|nr:hypothetical protein [Nocardioidaceae bacterium]
MSYEAAVLSWVDHLRSGGSTPWADFEPSGDHAGDVPGAAQLELVRLLAERWQGPGFERLADRVLRRDAPGRGLPRLHVVHPEAPRGVAVDPADVPVEELLRVGSGVLADLALAAPAVRTRQPRERALPLQAPSFDELMTRAWARRVQLGSGARWRTFYGWWAGRDQLPPSVDVAGLAQRLGKGRRRVEVYVGAAAAAEAVPLAVESVDLLRRVNPLLGVHRADPASARAGAIRLLTGGTLRTLPTPMPHRPWARRRAERLAEDLRAGGYAVHGDLDEFVAGVQGPPMYREDVLSRLVEVLVKESST